MEYRLEVRLEVTYVNFSRSKLMKDFEEFVLLQEMHDLVLNEVGFVTHEPTRMLVGHLRLAP